MRRYTLDAFTEKSLGTEFPENTWFADTADEVAMIIHNCARRIAGIRQVQVWIDDPHDEPARLEPEDR
jgi:hypothetical protein